MRNVHRYFYIALAALLFATTSHAEEGNMGTKFETVDQLDKSDCMLVAMNCIDPSDFSRSRSDMYREESLRGSDATLGEEQRSQGMPQDSLLPTFESDTTTGNVR